jgi:hypothetical protein
MLSKQAIKEYQEIYKKEFGEDINESEAVSQGTGLLNLFKIFSRPIPIKLVKKHTKK